MTLRNLLPISMNELTEDWRIWIGDKSLKSNLRFGQYVLNKRLSKGAAWSECYYADTTKAWEMLFAWINEGALNSKPRVVFH